MVRSKEEYLAEERENSHKIYEIEKRMAKDSTELAMLKARRKELITEAVNMVMMDKFKKEGEHDILKYLDKKEEKKVVL